MRVVAVAALVLGVVGCGRQPQAPVAAPATSGPGRCPVTIANGDGPPGEDPSSSYHGNGALWTGLPDDGIDRGGTFEPDGSTSQKYPWWTVGTEGDLAIEGHRLDAAAPSPLRARINRGWPETPFAEVRGGRFWSSAVYFPTEGCWQVTGRVGATSLTFVVLMAN
jgi:hypothetical protein